MAKMWPVEIPKYIQVDKRRSAEIRVFNKLRDELGSDWEVYYSRPWWGTSSTGGELDGEADFIICHPEQGILFVEVKGGVISYDPSLDQWFSTDRNEIRFKIKDPVQQALTCKHQFLKLFKKQAGWPTGFIKLRHGVIFTDSLAIPDSEGNFIGKYPIEVFGFQNDLNGSLSKWVKRRLENHEAGSVGEAGPGNAGCSVIRSVVAGPVEFKSSLSSTFNADNEQADLLLTGAQIAQLRLLQKTNRNLIEGPAGTGKTLIAQLWLKQMQPDVSATIYTTKSKTLLSTVKRSSASFGVECLPFDTLPEYLPSTQNTLAIAIDELQDLDHEELSVISKLLAGKDWRVLGLMDSNQAIYNDPNQVAERLGLEKTLLDINLRNSDKIAEFGQELYVGPLPVIAGPQGAAVETIECSDNKVLETLLQVLRRLISQGVAPQEIIVLTDSQETTNNLISRLQENEIQTKSIDEVGASVTVASVFDFKGLESNVVIVIASKELSQSRERSYVSVTRARNHLTIIGKFSNSVLGAAISKHR
jgi:hypothetical protein